MRRIDALIGRRTAERHSLASAAFARLAEEAERLGVSITLVGSLARGEFRGHSDVDVVVHGEGMTSENRAAIERLASKCLRDSRLPYDLVFEADIGTERMQEMIGDVHTSHLR